MHLGDTQVKTICKIKRLSAMNQWASHESKEWYNCFKDGHELVRHVGYNLGNAKASHVTWETFSLFFHPHWDEGAREITRHILPHVYIIAGYHIFQTLGIWWGNYLPQHTGNLCYQCYEVGLTRCTDWENIVVTTEDWTEHFTLVNMCTRHQCPL